MTLTSKVGFLLGKKQKSHEATFGEPLNLGQIALIQDLLPTGSLLMDNAADADITPPLSDDQSQLSVLDLDFMAEPLAEIELGENLPADAQQKSTEASALKNTAPQMKPDTAMPSPRLAAKININEADAALAQSLRSDTDAGFIIFGPDGRLIEMTDNFDNILGMPLSETQEITSYKDMLYCVNQRADLGEKNAEDVSNKEHKKMRELLAAGTPSSYSWVITMRSGKTLRFTNKYTANTHLVSLVHDISDQIEKDRLLRAGLELGTAGYWSYYFKTGKSTLSDYLSNKLSQDELSRVENKGLISIVHQDDVKRVQAAFDNAVSNKTRMDCELRIVLKGGKESIIRMIGEVEYSAASEQPEKFIAFLDDLTVDRQRLQELHDVKELSRNKSNFLARMSHEIRTPLNAIVGMTDALRDEVDNDDARETAQFIADAAENLNNILNQTLEHERLSTSQIKLDENAVDLGGIVRSTAAMWKKQCADKGLKLDIKISQALPKGVIMDSSRFRQCLTNLISNAVKFTTSGGIVIAVTTINTETRHPKILVAVRDTGIGMNANALKNIFKPFQQGNETIQQRFGGSGLGMSITHQIVEAMGGQIKVKSTEGDGALVAITLPLVKAESIDTADNHLDVEISRVNKTSSQNKQVETLSAEVFHPHEHANPIDKELDTKVRKHVAIVPSDYSGFDVLIVEDNPINQAVVRKLLNNHIASMDFAFHGQEALEILENKTFDVILMDIHMPIKDGIETTLEIRNSGKAWADTVIVALTADPDYQQKRVCRNIGMNDALSKPVKRQELLDALQRVLTDRIENSTARPAALTA